MNGDIPFPEVPPAPVTITPQSALFDLALFATQELLRHAPEMFAELAALFSKPGVTVADIDALRTEIAGTRYRDLVPQTQIPPAEQS